MRAEIRAGVLRDICYVASNLRDEDRREVFATAVLSSGSEAGVISFSTSPGWCWTAWLDGQPVAAFGVALGNPVYQPHIRHGWLFGREGTRRCIPSITRFCIREWPRRLISEGVTRVEVRSIDGHDLAQRWLLAVRARYEGRMTGYGTKGEDFHLFAWLAEDWKDSL